MSGKQTDKKFAVYLEICDVGSRKEAEELAEKIKHRFDDLELSVNVCISEYEKIDCYELQNGETIG